MRFCKCDNFYMAVQLDFILKNIHGMWFIQNKDKQRKYINRCPFCGKKLKQ